MDFLSRPSKQASSSAPLALPALRRPNSTTSAYVVPLVRDLANGQVVYLDRVAESYPRAVLIGAAGLGKTSALHFWAKDTPVLSLADHHPLSPPDEFGNQARIMIDDVMATRAHSEYLARLAARKGSAPIYAASADASIAPEGYARLALLPFHERQVSSAVGAWFPGKAGDRVLQDLKAGAYARRAVFHPLDLYLLLQIYQPGAALPENRAALYLAYVRACLASEPDPDQALRTLEGIALSMRRGQTALPRHLERGHRLLVQRPSGRIAFVHQLLHDMLAARALRHNPDPAPLLEHADDPDWEQVILFYAGIDDAGETTPSLALALFERGLVDLAARALAALAAPPVELQSKLAAPLIARAWESEDPHAIASLASLRAPSAVEFFAARLKERDPLLRARAARLLGQMRTDRAVETLLPQLRDSNLDVRDEVVRALAESKHDRVIEPLLVALRGDSRVGAVDTRLRVAAALALGRLGSEKAVPALLVDLQTGSPELRDAAAQALIEIRSDLSRRPLETMAASTGDSSATGRQVLRAITPRV